MEVSARQEKVLHTGRFSVVELQIFCQGQIGLKFVGPSACRTLAGFFVATNLVEAWGRVIQNHDGHASRQGPTRRFEI